MSHAADDKSWYQQGAVWLSLVALVVAGYALLSHRAETRRAQREEFCKLMAHLQESTSGAATAPGQGSSARAWIYFDAIRRLEPGMGADVSPVDCLILANFAFAHSDLPLGEDYVQKAIKQLDRNPSSTSRPLALMAAAHLYFKHYPKTDLKTGREYFNQSRAAAERLDKEQRGFVVAGVWREWAIDEYAAGNEGEGDAAAKKARQVLDELSLPTKYLQDWQSDLDHAIIQAKVRGGLL